MSKRGDIERAKQTVYRSGNKVSRREYDNRQRELREEAEEKRLKALGLVKEKPKLFVAQRQLLKRARR